MSLYNVKLPYAFQWSSQLPHVAWVDLYNNRVLMEVAVVSIDAQNGDLHFIRTDRLDDIDKKRLVKILQRRDAAKYPLWDLMSQVTLPNGMNALEFFNQLVKTRSVSGEIFTPNSGRRGLAMQFTRRPQTVETVTGETTGPAEATVEATAEPKRGPGRPKTK